MGKPEVISVRVTEEVARKLEALASAESERTGYEIDRSAILRMAVTQFLAGLDAGNA